MLWVVGAFALYCVLNTRLKPPFGKEFLAGETMKAFLVRTARYAVIIFVSRPERTVIGLSVFRERIMICLLLLMCRQEPDGNNCPSSNGIPWMPGSGS